MAVIVLRVSMFIHVGSILSSEQYETHEAKYYTLVSIKIHSEGYISRLLSVSQAATLESQSEIFALAVLNHQVWPRFGARQQST